VAITLEVLVERQAGSGAEQRADAAEFEELYASTYRSLVSYCRRLVRSNADAEEIAQEAFLRAWQSWDRYAPSRPFWPWVATIARRICIDRGRHSTMASATMRRRGPEMCHDRIGSPEELLEHKEDARLALTALETLKPDQRRVISLRDLDGWSYEDIARFEGTSVESIRGALRRARAHLRESYARLTWSSPAVLILGGLRRIKRRMEDWAAQTSQLASASSMAAARAGEALAAVIAITMTAITPQTAPRGVVVSSSAPSTTRAGGAAGGADLNGGPTGSGSYGSGPSGLGAWGAPHWGGPDGSGQSGGTGGAGGGAGSGSGPGLPSLNPGVPSPPSPPPPGRALGGPIPGSGGDKPEQASFTQFVASPHYAQDHELYATGQAYQDCNDNHCAVLYHSNDAGKTWTRLPALGFEGGTVMLPPAYPADDRVFVAGPSDLKVSHAGDTFTQAAPVTGAAAMSPTFSSGDGRILIGATPGFAYHDGKPGTTTPVDFGPLPVADELTFAFSPAFATDGLVVVGADSQPDGTPPPSSVVVCQARACDQPVALEGSVGAPAVLLSRSFGSDGLMYAWRMSNLYRSSDAGKSFERVALPMRNAIQAVTEDANGVLYVAFGANAPDGSTTTGGLFASHDRGANWVALGRGSALDHGVGAVTVLPGGKLLAAPYGNGGLLCSADAGRTWATRCSGGG
jgi:RNA polymerase sigma-70 factor, ECF subfamily